MGFRLLLANIGEGAYDGYAVGQFLVVLVVVLLEQGLADPPPRVLADGARHLVLIQDHFWLRRHTASHFEKLIFIKVAPVSAQRPATLS